MITRGSPSLELCKTCKMNATNAHAQNMHFCKWTKTTPRAEGYEVVPETKEFNKTRYWQEYFGYDEQYEIPELNLAWYEKWYGDSLNCTYWGNCEPAEPIPVDENAPVNKTRWWQEKFGDPDYWETDVEANEGFYPWMIDCTYVGNCDEMDAMPPSSSDYYDKVGYWNTQFG